CWTVSVGGNRGRPYPCALFWRTFGGRGGLGDGGLFLGIPGLARSARRFSRRRIRSWSVRIVACCSKISAISASRLVWLKSSALIPLAYTHTLAVTSPPTHPCISEPLRLSKQDASVEAWVL